MKVLCSKKSLKELAKVPKQQRKITEFFAFKVLTDLESIKEIRSTKKLNGHKSAYRVRFGDYRLGFTTIENKITLERILHRGNFYRNFP